MSIKEATISNAILPSIKITTEPKKKKKRVVISGGIEIIEKSKTLFECKSVGEVKQLFIDKS